MPRAGPGREVAGSPAGSRETIAPRLSTAGLGAPLPRSSVTRSCQEVRPASEADRQVSTFTSARSSPCPPTEVRRTEASPDVQRPSVSQLDVRPSALRPRTWISTQLSPGVVADQDETSSVRANGLAVQGAVQRPHA